PFLFYRHSLLLPYKNPLYWDKVNNIILLIRSSLTNFLHILICFTKTYRNMEKDKKILVPDNNSNSIHIMKEKNKGSAEKCNQEDTIISSHESEKIRHMRAQVEKQEPSSKDVDDLTMRRFLRARDLDIDKASTMFLKYFKWRQTFVPNGSFSKSEVPNEIAHNKVFIQGEDKQGRPIAVLYGGRHIQNKIGGVDELRRFVVFALDRLCSR
ncbi:hypothetical protein Leryth_023885, partial [Lithospermum erythrorhizon]